MSVNKVILLGRLGKDPEITYTQGGLAILSLSIATSEVWYENGDKKERTDWHRVKFFGEQGQKLYKHVVKGQELYVEGRIQYTKIENEGITKWYTDIIGLRFTFVGPKPEREIPVDANRATPAPAFSQQGFGHNQPSPGFTNVTDVYNNN